MQPPGQENCLISVHKVSRSCISYENMKKTGKVTKKAAKKTAKKTTKKSAKKTAKKTVKKTAAPKAIQNPTLYVHDTDTGPQLCLKTRAKGGDGVILPADKQAELNALYKEWTKKGSAGDFMDFPKAAKWTTKLIASCTFSKI